MPRFVIGTQTFATKQEATLAVRHILNEAVLDQPMMGDRAVLIRALFGMHPNVALKAAKGVSGFVVTTNDYHGARTRGFHVVHPDGSTTPWSYKPCLDQKAATPSPTAAMRAATMLGQRRVMMDHFLTRGAICSHCQCPIERATAHVHHEPPNRFRDIVAAYLAKYGEPRIVPSGGLGDMFADPLEQQRWIAFHDARAVRAVVCAPCNYAAERAAFLSPSLTDAAE